MTMAVTTSTRTPMRTVAATTAAAVDKMTMVTINNLLMMMVTMVLNVAERAAKPER